MPSTSRTLIVDDNEIIVEIVSAYLDTHHEFEIVGSATDGRAALALAENLKPDVILLDLHMPGMSGMDAIPLLKELLPKVHIVVISKLEEKVYRPAALAAGADEFVSKDSMSTNLIAAMRQANGK